MADQKKGKNVIEIDNVTGVNLAKVLGITPVRVSQLCSEGVIEQNGKGKAKYDLTDAVPAYINRYRRSGSASAKEKLAVQQERKLKLANDELAGSLVKIDDAAEVFLRSCLAWRSGSAALPRRLATRLSNTKNAATIRKILTEELDSLLHEFEKPLQEYFDDTGHSFEIVKAGSSRARTAPTKNTGPVGKRRKNTTARKRGTRKVSK